MSALAFIFASDSFTQAYRRVRYLREFSAWKDKKSADIKEAQAQLDRYLGIEGIKSAKCTSGLFSIGFYLLRREFYRSLVNFQRGKIKKVLI